ncbi:hypothetical protein E2C01_083035 [Portunus trituberculatus]|uniref:Uncharacterized protein n=1 Tax=Portunus trituberculatus TaxID=210409 RepID=A0A5B7IRE8_PORTR|nr:hypothetical protein [Portunus trituberculatus]
MCGACNERAGGGLVSRGRQHRVPARRRGGVSGRVRLQWRESRRELRDGRLICLLPTSPPPTHIAASGCGGSILTPEALSQWSPIACQAPAAPPGLHGAAVSRLSPASKIARTHVPRDASSLEVMAVRVAAAAATGVWLTYLPNDRASLGGTSHRPRFPAPRLGREILLHNRLTGEQGRNAERLPPGFTTCVVPPPAATILNHSRFTRFEG